MPSDLINIVKKKLLSMQELLEILKIALETYLQKEGTEKKLMLYAAEKKAEEIIELGSTINREILTQVYEHSSSDYYSSYSDLEKLKIFSEDFLKKLAPKAGFRNRLVHDYLGIKDSIALKTMEDMMKVYPEYIRGILMFLEGIEE
jgi:uncharacterized protein YutE (UPF0331/DUF86 family)